MMYLELFGGLVYLLLAGDLLVRGSIALAKRARIPPMIVGLTVVAFGTSAPELCVSLRSVLTGHPGLAIGNVVGSNIANVLLVLGLPALIHPTNCNQEALGRETLLVLAVSVLFAVLCFLGPLTTAHGALMVALLVVLIARSIRQAVPGEHPDIEEELQRGLGLPTRRRMIGLFLLLGGLGLPLGAHLVVEGGVMLAERLQVSDAIVGVSVIALGTSLPELATTVVAALHRRSDLALGNVLGSNLFNILAIMGITAVVAPGPIPVPPSFLGFDLFVMLGATLALGYFAWVSQSIGRISGAVLLAGYAAYIALLARSPGSLPGTS